MARFTIEEMQQIFRELEEAGWNPQLCDTPVPYYDATVQAGLLTDPGDVTLTGWEYIPAGMFGTGMMMLQVKGESMRDAGFSTGDRVVVDYEASVRDGDIVVASLGNDSTLKSLMIDSEGYMWLVPHNPDFEPVRLTEDMGEVRMGKVVQHITLNPRMPYREVCHIVDVCRQRRLETQTVPTRQQVSDAIQAVAPLVNEKRKWFAVYRVLVDRDVLHEQAYDTFVQWVKEDVPGHASLPDAKDLPRVSVDSFSKPVRKWDAHNAPVSGKRFRDYCEIARRVDELL